MFVGLLLVGVVPVATAWPAFAEDHHSTTTESTEPTTAATTRSSRGRTTATAVPAGADPNATATTDGLLLDPRMSQIDAGALGRHKSSPGLPVLMIVFEFIVISGVVAIGVEAHSRGGAP